MSTPTDVEDDEWVLVDRQDVIRKIPSPAPPTEDIPLEKAMELTDELIARLRLLLVTIADAKIQNNYGVVRNLLPQCQRVIETLRSKYLPILIHSSQMKNETNQRTISTSSQVALSSSLGITTGLSIWTLVPKLGVAAYLTAGTTGTLLCALLLFQITKGMSDRMKKENDVKNEVMERLVELEDVIPAWANDLRIDNVEEWILRLSDYINQEEKKRKIQ